MKIEHPDPKIKEYVNIRKVSIYSFCLISCKGESGYIWSPPQDRATDRLSLLHTVGTIREQLGTDMLAQYGDFGT